MFETVLRLGLNGKNEIIHDIIHELILHVS